MRPQSTDIEDDDPRIPRVRIHARIVPNGAIRDRKQDNDGCLAKDSADDKLQATLLLTPEIVPEGQPGGVRLDRWPAEVHAMLGEDFRMPAFVVPVAPGQERGAGHVACVERKMLSFRATGVQRLSQKGRKSDVDALCDMWLGSLWQQVPEKAEVSAEDWTALGDAIAASLGGSTVSSEGLDKVKDKKPEAALYGVDGQLAPTEAAANTQALKVVAALDIRHADLAVALEHQRAAALAASLRTACRGVKRPKVEALERKDVLEDDEFWKTGAAANTGGDNAALLEAIATQRPRSVKESFKAYAMRLTNASGLPNDRVIDALRRDGVVIAELRRRRRMGERTALYEALGTERGNARKTYEVAKAAIENTGCIGAADPEWRESTITPGEAARKEVRFDEITHAARYANWPQYRTPQGETQQADQTAGDKNRLEAALRSFFTMQSTPTLARVAMLAIDLELDPESETDGKLADIVENYAHIRADLPEYVASKMPRPWTLFRLREFEAERCYHFWPVSREEADCLVSPAPAGTVRHLGGLMVMGFGSDANAKDNTPRFDITSLDIRTAVELELQRRSIAQANTEAETEVGAQAAVDDRAPKEGAATTNGKVLPPGVNLPGEATDIEDEGDRQDVGLSLLDRGLCAQAIRKMAARDLKMGAPNSDAICSDEGRKAIVLDGEDLITGYRPYVGTPVKGCTKWHPMMSRAVKFGTTGPKWRHSNRVEPILTLLLGKAGSTERVALESAAMNVPGRMLPKQGNAGENDDEMLETEAVFEQAVSVWDGGPMGVDCAVRPGTENTTADTLIFGRELSIPTGSRYAIPRLRYGRPYRFALAAVYSGGRSVCGEDFPKDNLVEDTRADLYYPSERMSGASQACASEAENCSPPDVRPYVRALRQAKIGAPQVLLPEGHAMRVNGPMGPDQAGMMLVRSLDENKKNPEDARFTSRGQPASARRVVLIPSIPLARAATHMGEPEGNAGKKESEFKGVFDNLRSTPTTTGGLTFVRQQKGGCGFPAIKTRYLKGLNGVQHFADREVEDEPSDAMLMDGEDLDGAIFEAGSSKNSAYYPDPAAESLAIRVRLQGGTGRWLTMVQDEDDGFAPVDLIEGKSYPDRRRVLFTLKQIKMREESPKDLATLLKLKKTRWFDPAHKGSSEKTGRFLAREVTLRLAPHEWAEVEMWLVPSAKRLARDFAVIQALGIELAQAGKASIAATIEDMCTGAGLCLPAEAVRQILAGLEEAGGGQAFFGPGGVTAPPMQALLSLAQAVRRCMIAHPIPEISAVSRLQAVHASNRATVKPRIKEVEDDAAFMVDAPERVAMGKEKRLNPLRAFRPEEKVAGPDPEAEKKASAEPETESPRGDGDNPKPLQVCVDIDAPLKYAAKGSTGLVLTGDVELDLNQIDTIEVRARMAFPGSTTFDDRLRGRSLALRRAGWWPLVDKPSGAPPVEKGVIFRDSQSLFGFHVRPDGRAEFDRAEVTLLRAEQLPRPDGTTCINKVKLRRLFEETDLGDVRVTERHLFPDGKARRMKVWVNGLPRTAQFMRTADRRVRTDDAWVASEGLHHEVGELVVGEDLRAKAQCRVSDEVEVVLPATIRPAKPDALAPVPTFYHDKPRNAAKGRDSLLHRRRSVVRIPLGREWFSSGEDERLGIVLWPPKILPKDDWKLSQNMVTLRRHEDFGGDREIDLNDLRKYRLTKRTLADILCNPLGGVREDEPMPFEDGHLGPGGRFVSRRGADPVREGNPHRQILFASGDFPDLDLEEENPQRAELVEMVEMPLSDDEAHGGDVAPSREKQPPMLVSLLTYTPRFDVEKEQWYVDVTLEDSEAAETFVRFGLVRYQPHTRPGLRCSRPVRQFVQPLPDRIAEVTRIASVEGGGIHVRLCGPTFYRRRVSEALHEFLKPDATTPTPDENDPFISAGCSYDDTSDLLHGADAAPRMKVTLFRRGVDHSQRPYREIVPLPVSAVGREHRLLLPADHDTGVIGPENFEPIDNRHEHFFRLDPNHPVSAGAVAVKAAYTAEGEGIWQLKIPDTVLGGFEGLEVLVEEVEATEPADPPTHEELARVPVPSRVDARSPDAGEPSDSAPLNARVPGLHHGGARMRATFDLSGWA